MRRDQAQTNSSGERRTERVMLKIPIRVLCFGRGTDEFSEDTYTTMVNKHGALIALKHRVAPGTTLRIINLENLREADFRAVGEARAENEEVFQWGVDCLDIDRVLWDIDFPPALESKSEKAGALLECLGCRKQALLILSLTEIEMLESTGRLEKLCEQCGELSIWQYADVVRRAREIPSSEPASSPPQPTKWDGKTERRLHKRIALKLPAMVRNHKGDQETAKTEDISKGGLGICLSMALSVGEVVTVICPYTVGSQDPRQEAEVRRRLTLLTGQKWFYGLRYAPR